MPAVIDFFPTTDPDPDLKRGGGGGRAAPLRGCAPAPLVPRGRNRKALDSIRKRLSYVPVPGIGSVAMVIPSVIPRSPTDPLCEFTIRIPKTEDKIPG